MYKTSFHVGRAYLFIYLFIYYVAYVVLEEALDLPSDRILNG